MAYPCSPGRASRVLFVAVDSKSILHSCPLEVAEVPHVVASGRYDRSVVVKTAQGWRFKRRTLKVDGGFFKR